MVQILLLEDYPPLRHILILTLQRAGYQVLLAPSVPAVQQAWHEHLGDVLLVDVDGVPRGDWAALQALILAYPAYPMVALISPEHADQYAFAPHGSYRVLYKPVRRAALLREITWVIGHNGSPMQSLLCPPDGSSCPSLCSQNEI